MLLANLTRMENRHFNGNRPSNILKIVAISLIGLVALFVLGLMLESRNWEMFNPGESSSRDFVDDRREAIDEF
jgi:hypothetical protein